MSDDLVRQSPNDPKLERAALSDMLNEQEALAAGMSELCHGDFYDLAHQLVFRAISCLFAQQAAIDILALQQQLRNSGDLDNIGGNFFITGLYAEHISSANYKRHFQMLREFTVRRSLLKFCYEAQRLAYDPSEDLQSGITRLAAQLCEATLAREANPIKQLGEVALAELEYFLDLKQSGGLPTIKTGLRALDQVTGGLGPEYIILAARPSLGKTALSQVIATNIARQQSGTVLFFSAEMSAEQLARRQISSAAHLDLMSFKAIERLTNDQLVRAGQSLMQQTPVLNKVCIDDTPRVMPSHILSRARQIKARHSDLCLIVVDYIQILQPDLPYKSRREEISAISAQLKAISRIINVPLLALSQLSREPEKRQDKRPELADLREDGSLEQDCDMAWLVFRKDFYFEVPSEERNILQINVAKNRQGQRGICEVYFDESTMRVFDLEKRAENFAWNERKFP